MAFHILGDERGAAIKAIRTLPASAAVLAMRWLERGIERVRIEVDGRSYAPDIHRAGARTRLFKRSSRRRLRELSNAASRELNDWAARCPADETANSGRRSRGWLLAPHLAWTLYLFRSVLTELGAGASARWPRSFSRLGGKRRLVKRTLWTSHASSAHSSRETIETCRVFAIRQPLGCHGGSC